MGLECRKNPEYLDNAKVLWFSGPGDYGAVRWSDTGKVAHLIRYLAVCRYEGQNGCYLFLCDEQMEVVTDSDYDSVEEAKRAAGARGVMNWQRCVAEGEGP